MGLEMWIGPLLPASPHRDALWKFSQVCIVPVNFAVLAASSSFLGVPLYVFALFKMGFPEIVSGLVVSFSGICREKNMWTWVDEVYRFTDAAALLVHHTAGTILYACCLTHLVDMFSIGIVAFAAGSQHMMSFVKYAPALKKTKIYELGLLLFEVLFELEAFYIYPSLHWLGKVGMSMLLGSHWVWFVVAVCNYFTDQLLACGRAEGGEGEVEAAGRSSMVRMESLNPKQREDSFGGRMSVAIGSLLRPKYIE